jgi:hypothetical protein
MGLQQCTGWLGELLDLRDPSELINQDADWWGGSTIYRQTAGGGGK